MKLEATESLVSALLQSQGYFVTEDYKVRANGLRTFGGQLHDIDIDILAVDSHTNHVVVGEVKSYWGSTGLDPDFIVPEWTNEKGHHRLMKIVNNKDGIQKKLWTMLKAQIGEQYDFEYVVYVGRIRREVEVKRRLGAKQIFGKPVRLVVIRDLLKDFLESRRTDQTQSYVNHPAIATILALEEYGMIQTPAQPSKKSIHPSEILHLNKEEYHDLPETGNIQFPIPKGKSYVKGISCHKFGLTHVYEPVPGKNYEKCYKCNSVRTIYRSS